MHSDEILLPHFVDERGSLTVFEKVFPFQIKRVYWISAPKGSIRGGHAHKKNHQALVAISGLVKVVIKDVVGQKEFVLDSKEKCLLLEASDWHEMHFMEDSSLLVIASEEYSADDYVLEIK